MASNQEQKLTVTLLVDKEKNRVVVAEANGDFIDTLFSFLTLPLGTIIRLLFNDQQPEEEKFGCINNLYKSVENFSDGVFMNSICKKMLLYPRNRCESLCQMLKLNVDDSEPTKYFSCNNCVEGYGLLSTFVGARCSCGKLMEKEIKLDEDFSDRGCVFVKKEKLYLIFDDLKVIQSSLGNTLQQLQQLGYRNINKLTHMYATLGLKEIMDLLKKALTSKSPLSDVFLPKNGELYFYQMFTFFSTLNYGITMNLKVTVSKSKKKILYAEVEEDFVDFLFSFLTTPIGSILEQLNGNLSFGCMNNLHKSVKELDISCFIKRLDNPKVAHQFGCTKQPLNNIYEEDTPTWYWNGVLKKIIRHSKQESLTVIPLGGGVRMKLFDPRSPPYGIFESGLGFVKRPSQYVVWDNLQVTPLENNTSSIAFLQKLNIPLDDLAEHVVCITKTEALNLLGASLTSSEAVLTEALFHLVKKPKQETN